MLAGIEDDADVGRGGGGRELFGLSGLPGGNDTASDGDGSTFAFDLVVVDVAISFVVVSLLLTWFSDGVFIASVTSIASSKIKKNYLFKKYSQLLKNF